MTTATGECVAFKYVSLGFTHKFLGDTCAALAL